MLDETYREAMGRMGPSAAQIEGLWGRLEGATRKRPRHTLRTVLVAAAVCVALAASTLALSPVLRLIMAGHEIPEGFGALAEQMDFQPYSSAMGASVTDKGYTLTVDGIGIDDAFVTLYYTITGEEPIPMQTSAVGGEDFPKIWSMMLRADGTDMEFWGYEQKTELVDEHTLRVVQRNPVMASLPDAVELEIYTDQLFWKLKGDWSLRLTVDRSLPAAESLVAAPNAIVTMDGHEVTVEKVVVAPSGGGIVLSEKGANPQFSRFLLRDDRGNLLIQNYWGSSGSGIRLMSNFIEFYGGRADMTSITLIPWMDDGTSHQVRGSIEDLPLSDEGAANGYTLLSLEVGATKAVGVFQSAGILGESDVYSPDFVLLDAEGVSVDLGHVTYEGFDRDAETGLWTVTLTYPDATEAQRAAVAGVAFWQPSCILLEDQAVTIPLR